MSSTNAYKSQQNLSFAQLLSEVPAFIATLVSAIFSNTMLLFVDLMESFGNLLRASLVTILSNKLSKDLRFEYNYGVQKIEAIVSLFCNGIEFFGLVTTFILSIYAIIYPEQPSDLVIAVVGLKFINVNFDLTFFLKQRKILKMHQSAISEANYADALGALLFDGVTLLSLLIIWLLRNNVIGLYISPVISIIIAGSMVVGCVRRTQASLEELTDKTLPEEHQLQILQVLTRYFHDYSQVHSINSHKIGAAMEIDMHMSFEKNTNFEQIIQLKERIQRDLENQIGECTVNMIVESD